MAHPKRRHSCTRRDKRRTHDALKALELGLCPQCGQSKLSHRICTHCGYYKGRQIVEIKPKKKKPKK